MRLPWFSRRTMTAGTLPTVPPPAPEMQHPEMSITTSITQLLGIKYPILLAGMYIAGGPKLAAAVSNAGRSTTTIQRKIADSSQVGWV